MSTAYRGHAAEKGASPASAGKTLHSFGLAFHIEGVALLRHGDQAAARLALYAVQTDIESQAGIFVVQPVGTHVNNEVMQRTDDVGDQVLIVQSLSNHVVFLVGGKADGSGEVVDSIQHKGARIIIAQKHVGRVVFLKPQQIQCAFPP